MKLCPYCKSANLKYYDDGEGYPPNGECLDCERWHDAGEELEED